MSGFAFHPEAFTDLTELWNLSPKTTLTPPTG
jgi:hypothetical protein